MCFLRRFTLLLALAGLLAVDSAIAQQRSAPTKPAAQPEQHTGDKPEAEPAARYRAVPGTERLVLTPEGLVQARAFAAQKQRVVVPERSASALPESANKDERPFDPARAAYFAEQMVGFLQPEAPAGTALRPVEAGFSGNNSFGPTFARPSSVGNGTSGSCSVATPTTFPYAVETFDVSEGGSYDVFVSYDGYDGYLLLYDGPFDPNDPCRNLVARDDDFGGTGASAIEGFTLSAGVTYRAVVTTFSSTSPGGGYTGYVAEAGLLPTVFVVNSRFDDDTDVTPDGTCAGPTFTSECQLRSAINEANATAGTDPVFIAFDFFDSGSARTITLGFDGDNNGNADVLPTISRSNVTIDALTAPGASCGDLVGGTPHDLRVVINGSGTTGSTTSALSGNGLSVFGGSSTVRGLVVQDFAFGFGIYAATPGALVECNYVGTDAAGEAAAGNLDGVYAGGTVQNNLISGNSREGVFPRPFSPTTVTRNLIGTDDDGDQDLGNGSDGIVVGGADHLITGNVISGNGDDGIELSVNPFFTSTGPATGTVMTGNTIGLTRDRSAALGNSFGVYLTSGASDNDLGRINEDNNFISGNFSTGILVGTSDLTRIRNNRIGLTASGGAAPNTRGVSIGSASTNVTMPGNFVSGNTEDGIVASGSPGLLIRNNRIGLNQSAAAQGNGGVGIRLNGVPSPVLRENTVSGNASSGVVLSGATTGATVEDNRIGTTFSTGVARPNGESGLVFLNATTIGATVTGNTISANTDTGVFLDGGTSGHTFEANFIGTNAGSADLGNGLPGGAGRAGVFCQAATDVQFGRNGTGNVVANNGADGVFLASAACQEFSIVGNVISDNGGLGIDLAPNGVTPNDPGDADSGPNGLLNFPVITSAVNDGTTVAIAWTLNARPNRTYELLFCRVPTPDPSGFGECDDPNATVRTTTNASGNASGTRTLPAARYPVGDFVTATNTRVNAAAFGGYGPTSELSRAVEVEAAATTPPLTVTITPTSPAPPVTLTRGQRVFFDITFAVGPTGPPSFQYWTEAVLPNGNTAGPLIGPNTVNVSPPATVTVSFSQRVPSNAAFGSYAYRVNAGTFPSPVLESDAFQAQIVPSAAASGGEDGNEWLAFAADGSPALTGLVHDFREPDGTAAEAAARSEDSLPSAAMLEAIYPNPTRGAVTVVLALPAAADVRLAVYDMLGREAAVLVEGSVEAGRHEAALGAADLPAGVYLVRLEADDGSVQSQRVTILR